MSAESSPAANSGRRPSMPSRIVRWLTETFMLQGEIIERSAPKDGVTTLPRTTADKNDLQQLYRLGDDEDIMRLLDVPMSKDAFEHSKWQE